MKLCKAELCSHPTSLKNHAKKAVSALRVRHESTFGMFCKRSQMGASAELWDQRCRYNAVQRMPSGSPAVRRGQADTSNYLGEVISSSSHALRRIVTIARPEVFCALRSSNSTVELFQSFRWCARTGHTRSSQRMVCQFGVSESSEQVPWQISGVDSCYLCCDCAAMNLTHSTHSRKLGAASLSARKARQRQQTSEN